MKQTGSWSACCGWGSHPMHLEFSSDVKLSEFHHISPFPFFFPIFLSEKPVLLPGPPRQTLQDLGPHRPETKQFGGLDWFKGTSIENHRNPQTIARKTTVCWLIRLTHNLISCWVAWKSTEKPPLPCPNQGVPWRTCERAKRTKTYFPH